MADIDVLAAEVAGGKLSRLQVQFKNAAPRSIDREKAVTWLREGHSMIPVSGHGHDVHRGGALQLIEIDGEAYVRTDTKLVAADDVHFPHGH